MFDLLRKQTVWLTVAMLLMQAVCPRNGIGCGCQSASGFHCQSNETGCCCCAGMTSKPSPQTEAVRCPHCTGQNVANQTDAVRPLQLCHCGDHDTSVPPQSNLPDSTNTSLQVLLDLVVAAHVGVISEPVLTSVPNTPPSFSCETLTNHYKQIVLGVWRT
ncbi:hypothetical protein [Rhodopirellula sp. MGV]|uniref:hypothetical protein n=1 Tax=Rhodopirellula sp. MGV TaxID=2023130 RepID=UPI00117ABAE0|nr:hypothetical protein [Rhodopirellula sp. MGV]